MFDKVLLSWSRLLDIIDTSDTFGRAENIKNVGKDFIFLGQAKQFLRVPNELSCVKGCEYDSEKLVKG